MALESPVRMVRMERIQGWRFRDVPVSCRQNPALEQQVWHSRQACFVCGWT